VRTGLNTATLSAKPRGFQLPETKLPASHYNRMCSSAYWHTDVESSVLFWGTSPATPVTIGISAKIANTGCYFQDSTKKSADLTGAVVLERRPKLGHSLYSEI
jgi:hypothetical protein